MVQLAHLKQLGKCRTVDTMKGNQVLKIFGLDTHDNMKRNKYWL